jgi:hypothetical protein
MPEARPGGTVPPDPWIIVTLFDALLAQQRGFDSEAKQLLDELAEPIEELRTQIGDRDDL